jgi:hypothetical protein
MSCQCSKQRDLIEISGDHHGFVEGKVEVDVGNWIRLWRCPSCGQYWRTDEWDKYQAGYALKIASVEGWKELDPAPWIKQRMLENHHGTDQNVCLAKDCNAPCLTGRAYCVDHFYETGARA